uniref:Uncharacterized protein n=1 Tax=Anguilla anguilla TaxID=7936 RepID=A0A0E9US87_ANGAN
MIMFCYPVVWLPTYIQY